MRVGNYPICDSDGNQIDTDYLETDNIQELKNAINEETLNTINHGTVWVSFTINYNDTTQNVDIRMTEKDSIKPLSSVSISVNDFTDILKIACDENKSLDQIQRVKDIKLELIKNVSTKYIINNIEMCMYGLILVDDIFVGTFEKIKFKYNDWENTNITISDCICDKLNKYKKNERNAKIVFSHDNKLYEYQCNFRNNSDSGALNIYQDIVFDNVIEVTSSPLLQSLSHATFDFEDLTYDPQDEESIEAFYVSRKNIIKALNTNSSNELNEFENMFEL